jgi:hypothetical protein
VKRFFGEPLVHFLLLGAALFVIYGRGGGSAGGGSIVVSAARIGQLAAGFERVWQRPPMEDELRGLVEDFVREEVWCREALALGLDRDDTVIRRRLRQKVEFLTEGTIAIGEPSEQDLRAFLASHPERFRVEPRASFRQIYLSPDRRGERAPEDAREILATLRERDHPNPADLGDPFLLPLEFADTTPGDVRRAFGDEFARQLFEVETGRWTGPLTSGYGLHLVLVGERVEGRMPDLDEVRAEVEREWRETEQRERAEQLYAGLLERYDVTVEWPEAAAAGDPPEPEPEPAGGPR